MCSLPDNYRPRAPHARLSDLHPGARGSGLVVAESHGADRELVLGDSSRLELGGRRNARSLRASHPLFAERARARFGIDGGAALFQPNLVGVAETTLRTELRSPLVRGLVLERCAAAGAWFLHALSLIVGGLFTVPRHGKSVMPSLFDLVEGAAV